MISRRIRIRLREIDDIGGANCFMPMKGEVYLAELEFFKASRPQYDRFYCVNMHEEITLILLKISSSRVRDLILLSDRQHSSRTRTGIHWTRRKNRACCERCFTSRVHCHSLRGYTLDKKLRISTRNLSSHSHAALPSCRNLTMHRDPPSFKRQRWVTCWFAIERTL